MAKITDETNTVLFEGEITEMQLVFDYLTKPFYLLAEERGLRMSDAFELRAKYWNDRTRSAKSFQLITN